MENKRLEPWMTPRFRKALEELERLKGDERMRQRYEQERVRLGLWATDLHASYKEGYADALAEARDPTLRQKHQAKRKAETASLVRAFARQRFGPLPEWLDAWLPRDSSVATLKVTTDAALEAASLDELRARLEAMPDFSGGWKRDPTQTD